MIEEWQTVSLPNDAQREIGSIQSLNPKVKGSAKSSFHYVATAARAKFAAVA